MFRLRKTPGVIRLNVEVLRLRNKIGGRRTKAKRRSYCCTDLNLFDLRWKSIEFPLQQCNSQSAFQQCTRHDACTKLLLDNCRLWFEMILTRDTAVQCFFIEKAGIVFTRSKEPRIRTAPDFNSFLPSNDSRRRYPYLLRPFRFN